VVSIATTRRAVRAGARRGCDLALGVPAPFDASLHPNLAGPAQTRLGAWFDHHDMVTRVVAVLALLGGALYLTWRIGFSFNDSNPVVNMMLLIAEMFGYWSLVCLTVFSWSNPPARRPEATPGRSVDVIVCTYDESVAVLRTTLTGCRALTYPHTTYLLDDGRRESMRVLAEEMGAIWLTRPDNSHAKAGNINAALDKLTGELVFVLDADHVPLPDALDAVVGYFDDERLAVVQSPHDFYNHDSAQHYGVGRHEQSVFYEVVLPGKDRHNAAFWCGSATVLRLSALLEVGGVATETIAEDFHTTMKMHSKGWSTKYHNEVLVQGLGPHDLDGYLLQRDRWARGNLAVLASTESPLTNRNLSLMQRWSYSASLASYAAPAARIATLLVLIITLTTGALPLRASVTTIVGLWLPWMIGSMLAATALCRGHIRLKESVHYELCCAEIYTRALRCMVRPAKTAFKVTPKEGLDLGGFEAIKKLRLTAVLLAALLISAVLRVGDTLLGLGVLPTLPGIAVWLIPILAVLESRRLARSLVIVSRRRQRRTEYRFPLDLHAEVHTGDGFHSARLTDASLSGVGVEMDATLAPERGATVEVTTAFPTVTLGWQRATLHATVNAVRPIAARPGFVHVGCAVADLGDAEAALIECCYLVVPYQRLRGVLPVQVSVPLTLAAETSDAFASALDLIMSAPSAVGAGSSLDRRRGALPARSDAVTASAVAQAWPPPTADAVRWPSVAASVAGGFRGPPTSR
jgi:cellulose synthase (UDP-forming)